MVDFILGIDWWIRALVYAAALIIFAANEQYRNAAAWVAAVIALIMYMVSGLEPSKWSLLGDFIALFWLHKALLPKHYAIYFIGLAVFIYVI